MKKLLSLFLSLHLLACQGNKQDVNHNASDTSASKKIYSNDFPRSLIGLWSEKGAPNPIFEIKADSIYYPDQDLLYRFQIKEDSLTIFYEDYIYTAKIVMPDSSTIILENNDGSVQYVRFLE
jgi:hypothetical protein